MRMASGRKVRKRWLSGLDIGADQPDLIADDADVGFLDAPPGRRGMALTSQPSSSSPPVAVFRTIEESLCCRQCLDWILGCQPQFGAAAMKHVVRSIGHPPWWPRCTYRNDVPSYPEFLLPWRGAAASPGTVGHAGAGSRDTPGIFKCGPADFHHPQHAGAERAH